MPQSWLIEMTYGSARHKPLFTVSDIGAVLALSFPLLRYSSFPELRMFESSCAEGHPEAETHKLPLLTRLLIMFGLAMVAWAIVVLPVVSIV